MFDYVKLFQEKAGSITGDKKPNRPALLLYIGDIAVRGRKQLMPKLLSQIPEVYHGVLVEGALCSDAEADDLVYLSMPVASDYTQFGQFAKEWLDKAGNQNALEQFLAERIRQTTISNVAVAMAELDLYLIVGNDGGACELLPTVVEMIRGLYHAGAAIRRHLVWLWREMYPQTRDAAMCGLMNAIEQKDKTAPEVEMLPKGECLFDDAATITLISDRNLDYICSEDTWANNCCGISGYVLANLFSKQTLPACNTCSMYDSIYPDMFWSTGFQLSLLLKLDEMLILQRQNALLTFKNRLADAWGCSSLDTVQLLAKLEQALPSAEDLLLIPVNPDISKKDIKNQHSFNSAVYLLYGERFQQFFDDALESPSLRQLEEKMTDELVCALQKHGVENGVYAVAALLSADDGLPHFLKDLGMQSRYTAKLPVGDLPKAKSEEQLAQAVYMYGGREKINELKSKAAQHLIDILCKKMMVLQPEYEEQASALKRAMQLVEQELRHRLNSYGTPYAQQIKTFAESKHLYATTVDAGEMKILHECFTIEQPEQSLIKALAEMNLRENELITTPLQQAFVLLHYTNGENELRSTLDKMCSAAMHTPALLTQNNIYILPGGGDWSNGANVYGLIRVYSSDATALLSSVSHLSVLLRKPNRTELVPGIPYLPPQQVDADVVVEAKETTAAVVVAEEDKKTLGSLKYSHPNTLVRFEWPERSVNVMELSITGATDCGKNQYSNTLHVSKDSYVKNGGAVLNNVRLTGSCDITLTWSHNGQPNAIQGILAGEAIYVSRMVIPKKNDYVFRIKTNENVTDLQNYLLMRVRKPNGVVVDYRLPRLSNDEFSIPQKGCTRMPEIILAREELSEYISF